MNDLDNALDKLESITAEDRAYLMTPAEARALSTELAKLKRRQALFHRGSEAAAGLVAAEWLDSDQTAEEEEAP